MKICKCCGKGFESGNDDFVYCSEECGVAG